MMASAANVAPSMRTIVTCVRGGSSGFKGGANCDASLSNATCISAQSRTQMVFYKTQATEFATAGTAQTFSDMASPRAGRGAGIALSGMINGCSSYSGMAVEIEFAV